MHFGVSEPGKAKVMRADMKTAAPILRETCGVCVWMALDCASGQEGVSRRVTSPTAGGGGGPDGRLWSRR